ncbi:MAG: hypothetical protein EXX96DRAFT_144593 [Benjaminiella poitrasii]|nr:MAG: hypothetical protein EXX96DRAFT_144593 [Benjaminiella poitrasii]
MAEERKRIILFNCNEYVDFNTGEVTLPTRITCYCRHHGEKTGFRLKFTLKDSQNHVMATGRSPPIMITDDHKSSKMQIVAAKKRARADLETSATESDAPSISRKKAATVNAADAETDSGVSSPITSTPATPSSQLDDIPESSSKLVTFDSNNNNNNNKTNNNTMPTITAAANNNHNITITTNTNTNTNTTTSNNILNNGQPYPLGNNQQPHPLSEDNHEHFISQLQQQQEQQQMIPSSSVNNTTATTTTTASTVALVSNNNQQLLVHHDANQISQNELLDFLNSNDLSLLSDHLSNNNNNNSNQQQPMPIQYNQNLIQNNNINIHMNNSRRRATMPVMNQGISCQQQQQQYNPNTIYTKLQERNALEGSKLPHLPRLHRLIPSEGPIYGGSEVTVLGSNFYEGLTCMFGENPAIPTHCWSPNTLLCILPPAATAGPVVVSFKEHPLMLEGQDVVLFTYFDESDRALMELALQVVGLKTMGKVEDARQIAMRIVQGDNNNNTHGNNSTLSSAINQRSAATSALSPIAAGAIYDNARKLYLSQLEELIASSMLVLHNMKTPHHADHLSLTNQNQHSLLHLATICGYVRLVKTLIRLNCNVNQVDKNGYTALHFASWSGKVEIVELLIDSSNLTLVNNVGKTAERLAIEAGHKHIVQLFRRKQQQRDSLKLLIRKPVAPKTEVKVWLRLVFFNFIISRAFLPILFLKQLTN